MKIFTTIAAIAASVLMAGCEPPIKSAPGGNENSNANSLPNNPPPSQRSQ